MPLYKRCPNCKQLYQGAGCLACKAKRDRAYQKRKLIDDKTKQLYNTQLWRNCREIIKLKYLGYDIWLLGAGIVQKIEGRLIIHHIKERQEAPDLFLDIDNLITVSQESHEDIHIMYRQDKAAALARIEQGKANFKKMFED